MNELKVRGDALRWYLKEKRDDPRIPDPSTDEGRSRLKVLCVFQATLEPDFSHDDFERELAKLKPEGAGREWSLVHGWHNPEDVKNEQAHFWPHHWESSYRDFSRDERRLKMNGFEERAKLVRNVLDAIEEAFPEMVTHLKDKAGVKRA